MPPSLVESEEKDNKKETKRSCKGHRTIIPLVNHLQMWKLKAPQLLKELANFENVGHIHERGGRKRSFFRTD